MAAPYSQDLRDRVLAAYDRGMKTKRIAETFAVSPAWARRIKQVRRESGRTTPAPMGGHRFQRIDLGTLAALVAAQPDATLAELRDRLGTVRSTSAVDSALKKLNLTLKERRSTPPSRTGPMSPRRGSGGGRSSHASPAAACSSSTRRGPRPTCCVSAGGRHAGTA